jgi:ABC-2 type transport system permease protein
MAQKDLRLLLRDWPGLFWLLAFPLIMALFFGSIFIGMGDEAERAKIEVAFVDNTGGMPYAADFKAELDSLGPITVWPTTLDSAKMMVRLGRRQAYLMLSPDTTAREGFSMYPGGVPELAVGIDPSRQAESGILRGLLTQVHFKLVMAQFTDPGRARSMISESMAELDTLSGLKPDQKQALTDMFSGLNSFFDQAEKDTAFALEGMGGEAGLLAGPNITIDEVTRERTGPRSSFDVTFPQALMWGLIGCVAAFSMSIVTERTRGTFHRLRLAPVSRGQIIGGKALACLVASIGVCVLLMAAGVGIFGVSLDEPLKLALAIAASAVCFVGLMMLISVLGKSEQAVSGAGWAIMLIFSMTGGGMIPLVAMPGWFLSLSKISPVRWGIISLEGAIWRGYSYAEMMPAVTILLVVGIVGYAIGVWILTKSDH